MSPDDERLIGDVTAGLPAAPDVNRACQVVADGLGQQPGAVDGPARQPGGLRAATPADATGRAGTATPAGATGCPAPARVTVLLWVHDRLRCVAATGSWQVFATVPPGAGAVGQAFAAGKTTQLVPSVAVDRDHHLPLRPDVTAELCCPLFDADGRTIGVLDLEWVRPVELDRWQVVIEQIASQLSQRIDQLGGVPAESRSEQLLRHATALTAAPTEGELLAATCTAARDVSGLSTAVFLITGPASALTLDPAYPDSALAGQLISRLTGPGQVILDRLMSRVHRLGTSYTLGEEGHPPIADHEPLVAAGVGTLIAVPVGPPSGGGVLIAADERLSRPDPTTVHLIELLAAQAWLCRDRLRRMAALQERADSDPLTGLRHHGPFGERITRTTPGRTALLAIDVDDFKFVNDTYGHEAGDRALVDLARALETELRADDELYRIGGDEFVAVVEVLRADEAVGIAERLAAAARRTGRTISVGVALRLDGESPELTLRRADAALYGVKRDGRDGVRLATPG